MMFATKDLYTPAGGVSGHHPGTRPGERARRREPGGQAFAHGSSWAQPKRDTWVRPLVGPPPAREAKGVQCIVDQATVKGNSLDGLILGS